MLVRIYKIHYEFFNVYTKIYINIKNTNLFNVYQKNKDQI